MKRQLDQRKMFIAASFICGMIVFVVFIYFMIGNHHSEDILKEYFTSIENQDYQSAYQLLDESSQQDIKKENYIERVKNIYEGINAKNIIIDIKDIQDTSQGDVISYEVKIDTIAGLLEFENKTIIKENKLVWNDECIYPGLKSDDKVKVSSSSASRGQIMDANGHVLAGPGEANSVGLVRGKLNGEADYEKISNLLGVSKEIIQKNMNLNWVKDDSFVPLKTISKDDSRKEALLTIPGVKLTTTLIRSYPYGKVTSHLVGYLQKVTAEDLEKHKDEGYTENSYIGRSGIEAAYEKELKGEDGIKISIINKDKNEVSTILEKAKQDGQNIALTIDIDLQKALYDEYQNDKSASVAMNPITGEMLALVSTPSFDSNNFILGYSSQKWDELNNNSLKPLLNRFKGTWVPGSSMKPITAAIGLESGKLDSSQDLGAQMKWQKDSSWGSYYVTTLHAPQLNNLKNALVYSDNVYFAKSALMIGKDNLEKGYKTLQIGEKIPFELSLSKSQYMTKSFDNDIQIADSGYGQGELLMNPVQLASIYGSFVNMGNIMTPYVVKETESKIWISQAINSKHAEEIKNDLIDVISTPEGTGHSIFHQGINLAGKTGTAEIKASQNDVTGTEIGWFTVMTTDSNKPILITTMVEDVKNRGGSGYIVNHMKKPLDIYLKK